MKNLFKSYFNELLWIHLIWSIVAGFLTMFLKYEFLTMSLAKASEKGYMVVYQVYKNQSNDFFISILGEFDYSYFALGCIVTFIMCRTITRARNFSKLNKD